MFRKPSDSNMDCLYPELVRYLSGCADRFDDISTERKEELARVADYIRDRVSKSEVSRLVFVCTHNSRRSHLSQIWAQVAALFFGVKRIETFSGGTEATAMNPRIVATLTRSGLRIKNEDTDAANPHYKVFVSDSLPPMICFSKLVSDSSNPREGFCAVMTCSQADEACPLVSGCDLRIPLRYDDPKIADDTEFERQCYDERCAQICAEMLYLMSQA